LTSGKKTSYSSLPQAVQSTQLIKRKNIFCTFVIRMKFFAKILIFLVLLLGCSSSRPRAGKISEKVQKINNRDELRSLQRARRQRAENIKAEERAQKRKIEKAMPEVTKQKEEEEKRAARAMKEGKKRHLKWQSKETKRRMRKSEKEARRRMRN
jgi:type IV secretory pathway VirB10-like protein